MKPYLACYSRIESQRKSCHSKEKLSFEGKAQRKSCHLLEFQGKILEWKIRDLSGILKSKMKTRHSLSDSHSHSDDLGNLNLRDSRRTQILLLQVGVSQGRRVWAAAAGREPPDAAAASPSCSGNIEEYLWILEMPCNIDDYWHI